MLTEKKVFGWAASHACSAFFTPWSEVNWRPLMPLWVDETSGSQTGQNQDYTEDELLLQTSFRSVSAVWAAICGRALSCNNTTHFDSSPRCLLRIAGFSLSSKHFTVPSTVCSCAPLLIMLQYWALWVPKHCKHQFSCGELGFELYLAGRLWMFPFHTLPFSLRLIMMDQCFVTSDYSV